MKQCESLFEILEFIKKKHRKINAFNSGVNGFKLLRKPSGSRILFEEIRGWRIFEFNVYDQTSVIINSLAAGLQFKQNKQIKVSSSLMLADLVVVNVYDHSAEFFSDSSIDFVYIESENTIELQLLSEWVNDDPGILRAQWVNPTDSDIIDKIFGAKKILSHAEDKPRLMNMSCDIGDFNA